MKNFKNNTTKMLIALIVLFIIASCKKDKNGANNKNAQKNSYTYQNGGNPITVKIKSAVYLTDGLKTTFKIFAEENGRGIEIKLTSSKVPIQIPEGTFTKNSSNATFSYGILYYGNDDESYIVQGIDRQITIQKNGDSYTLNFEFTTGMGLITGNYTGTITRN